MVIILFSNCGNENLVTELEETKSKDLVIEFSGDNEINKPDLTGIDKLHELISLKGNKIQLRVLSIGCFNNTKEEINIHKVEDVIKIQYLNENELELEKTIGVYELRKAIERFRIFLCNLNESIVLTTLNKQIEILNDGEVIFTWSTNTEFIGVDQFITDLTR